MPWSDKLSFWARIRLFCNPRTIISTLVLFLLFSAEVRPVTLNSPLEPNLTTFVMVKQKDVHRLFKQAMISRRCVTEDLATILWKKCEEACRSLNENIPSQFEAAEIGTYIQEINDTITPLSLEFKSRIDEVSGKRMWALVNTVDGDIAQVATEYSATEITFFKHIIELIVLAPADAYSVSSLAAIREVTNMKASMTKSQAEAALSNFVANGWLYRSDRGRYALSTRSLVELEVYLRRTYENDVPECSYCTELVTLGVACNSDDRSCRAVLHRHCYDLLRRSPNNFKCPLCKADWTQGGAVRKIGEDAVPEGFDDTRRRAKRTFYEEEEEEELTAEEEESAVATPPPISKKQKRAGKSRLVKQDSDGEEEE